MASPIGVAVHNEKVRLEQEKRDRHEKWLDKTCKWFLQEYRDYSPNVLTTQGSRRYWYDTKREALAYMVDDKWHVIKLDFPLGTTNAQMRKGIQVMMKFKEDL